MGDADKKNNQDKAEEALKRRASGGQIACREALALADELDVAPRVVGDAANKLGIKIRACQLGCFK
ncbi:MAG: hypothetical protein ACM3TT_06345 [Syntrophothermus sp.]